MDGWHSYESTEANPSHSVKPLLMARTLVSGKCERFVGGASNRNRSWWYSMAMLDYPRVTIRVRRFHQKRQFYQHGVVCILLFLFPPKSQFYGLSFVIMFPIQIDIMAIPYARVFFDDPTTLKVQRLILPPAVLIHWWKRKGQVSHWDFRSLQHEISWKISLMKHFFHWMWRDFPIESFISLFPQRRCARGLPMLHFCRLLCVAQEPFEIDDLCGGGPRLTWGRPLAPIQLMGKSWIKVG